ncbi:hypothetical protein [Caulobacter soli]|uniref:hypothetical protein n=1 Tax=Caulobacter soli TaxID=2708539 RepID=UPI0013EDAF03|nr:hypothetical protein [Caulobacter soli]
MSMFPDKMLPMASATPQQIQEFQIAWLNRRIETLENIVFELLRDRVNHEGVEAYRKFLTNPGFGPSSAYIKDRGKRFVWEMQQNFPPENLEWPPIEKGEPDSEASS